MAINFGSVEFQDVSVRARVGIAPAAHRAAFLHGRLLARGVIAKDISRSWFVEPAERARHVHTVALLLTTCLQVRAGAFWGPTEQVLGAQPRKITPRALVRAAVGHRLAAMVSVRTRTSRPCTIKRRSIGFVAVSSRTWHRGASILSHTTIVEIRFSAKLARTTQELGVVLVYGVRGAGVVAADPLIDTAISVVGSGAISTLAI